MITKHSAPWIFFKIGKLRNTGIQHFWEECKLNSLMTVSTRGVRNRFHQAASQWSFCKKAFVKSQSYSQAWHWGLEKLSTNLSIDLNEINVSCCKVGWLGLSMFWIQLLSTVSVFSSHSLAENLGAPMPHQQCSKSWQNSNRIPPREIYCDTLGHSLYLFIFLN